MIDDKDLAEALDRIARSPDGRLLYLYCQKTLCQVLPSGQTEGALREHDGRRRFASELMGRMAEGIQDSDRHAITFSVDRAARARTGTSAGAYFKQQRADAGPADSDAA